MKVLIGLTGNAGAGKSTVARMFQKLGFTVIDADREAHQVLKHPEVIAFLEEKLPSAIGEDGKIDRNVLGEMVFKDPQFKEEFERVIRPLVLERIKRTIERSPAKVIMVDAALLFEYGVADAFDTIIVVWAPEEELVHRLIKRGVPEERAKAILSSQMPQEEKIKRADFVIRNYGSLKDVERQVKEIARTIMRKIEEIELSWYL
ncbi:MAG: dephospho-CoA kinase [Thermotogae bacterium]|nr:dephospho-CoA kinase [Thermotogota bacterium]